MGGWGSASIIIISRDTTVIIDRFDMFDGASLT
jgi:hypothetical protein